MAEIPTLPLTLRESLWKGLEDDAEENKTKNRALIYTDTIIELSMFWPFNQSDSGHCSTCPGRHAGHIFRHRDFEGATTVPAGVHGHKLSRNQRKHWREVCWHNVFSCSCRTLNMVPVVRLRGTKPNCMFYMHHIAGLQHPFYRLPDPVCEFEASKVATLQDLPSTL